MKEKENTEKEYKKALKAAESLSKTLEKDIAEARSKQAEFESYKTEAEQALAQWKKDKEHRRYYRAKQKDAWAENLSRYKSTLSIFKTYADEKSAEKAILDAAILTVKEKIGNNVTTSDKTLLATAKHLNVMVNLIDPPFNYKKLPGILLTILGSLSTLTGLGFLIAAATVAGILLLPIITIPALFFGGFVVAGAGAMWWFSVAEHDSQALMGCKKIQKIKSGKDFPSDDEFDKSTVYYSLGEDNTIKTRWYENDGTLNGTIKDAHITDQAKCQEILNLAEDTPFNHFDEMVALLGYPSLTVQTLNVEKAALAKAIPSELTSPVDMPSSSPRTSTTATGVGLYSTLSSTPFAEPVKTEGKQEPTATPAQGPGTPTNS